MKKTRKLLCVLLSVLIMLSSTVVAFALDNEKNVQPNPVDNEVSTSAYVKTVIKNQKVKQKNAVKLFTAANILLDLDSAVSDAVSNVFVGQNVIAAIGGISNAISQSLENDPKLSPAASLVKFLFTNNNIVNGLNSDEKFSGAVEKLQNATKNGFMTIPDVIDNGIEFTSADFGFEDGDAYGFFDSLVCSLSYILSQLSLRATIGDFTDSVKENQYVVGNYNCFIPLYEILELNPISSVEFTELVKQAELAEPTSETARFRTVANLTLKPVADLMTKIENGGLSAVIDILPKLLYALNSGMVNDLLNSLLKDKTLLYIVEFNDIIKDVNISTDLLWDIIDKKLVTGSEEEPAGFDFDNDGVNETKLPLTKEQFDSIIGKLEFAANPSVKSSVSSTQKNRLALDTDSALVKEILLDSIVEFLESDEGSAFAKKAVDFIDNATVKSIANGYLNMFRTRTGRFVLRTSQDLISNIAPILARLIKFFRTV